jgi:hypothetical protein
MLQLLHFSRVFRGSEISFDLAIESRSAVGTEIRIIRLKVGDNAYVRVITLNWSEVTRFSIVSALRAARRVKLVEEELTIDLIMPTPVAVNSALRPGRVKLPSV